MAVLVVSHIRWPTMHVLEAPIFNGFLVIVWLRLTVAHLSAKSSIALRCDAPYPCDR